MIFWSTCNRPVQNEKKKEGFSCMFFSCKSHLGVLCSARFSMSPVTLLLPELTTVRSFGSIGRPSRLSATRQHDSSTVA